MSLSQLDAITQRAYIPLLQDNVYGSNPLFVFLMRKGKKLRGGSSIVQPVTLTKNSTAMSYQGVEVLNTAYQEEDSGAEFNWAQYAATVQISGLDEARNDGEQAVINIVSSKVQNAGAALRDKLGTDLQLDGTGNNGKNIIGLAAAIDDSTNVATYGNISRTTYTNWRAQYSANGGVGRALTLNLMQTSYGNASIDNNRPNLFVTTQDVYNKYNSLLQPNLRYSDSRLADMGFPNLFYHGRPFVVDGKVTTSNDLIWGINLNTLDLYFHQKRFFKWVPFQTREDRDAIVGKILVMCQLVCKEPRLNFQCRDIDPTL